MLDHDPLDGSQLLRTKSQVAGEADRIQPELHRQLVPVHMHMGRLANVVAHKV